MPGFVNRTSELALLSEAWESEKSEFVVLYGRRRIGKTELLRHFTRDIPCLFFSADLSTESDQLRQFSERIHRYTEDPALQGERFTRWDNLLEYLVARAKDERLLAIIDEFPYLCASNKALPSILQRVWDGNFESCKLKLVLCGSTLSFMEKEVLGHKSPLYGRRTAQIHLDPLHFSDQRHFFPEASFEDRVALYGTVGGVPAYMVKLDPALTPLDNIGRKILTKGNYLYEEVRFLLMEELREPNRYFSILRAIAHGKHRSQAIAEETGLENQLLSKYLGVLRDLRIIRREVPITEQDPSGSRRGQYVFEDPFFRFWFRYVFSYRSFLDQDQVGLVRERFLEPTFEAFLELPFRQVVGQWVQARNLAGELPLLAHRFGAWWLRSSSIDLVGLDDDGRAIAVNTRWSGDPLSGAELSTFLSTVASFAEHYSLREVIPAFASRPGFRPEVAGIAKAAGCLLWGSEDIAESAEDQPARDTR